MWLFLACLRLFKVIHTRLPQVIYFSSALSATNYISTPTAISTIHFLTWNMFGFVTVWVAPIFTYTRETIQFYSFCGDWFELPVREIELRASCSVICTFTNKTLILDIKSPATFSFNAQTRCTCRKTTRPLFIRQIIIITTEQLNREDFSIF